MHTLTRSQEAADEEYHSEKEEADVFDSDFGDEEVGARHVHAPACVCEGR